MRARSRAGILAVAAALQSPGCVRLFATPGTVASLAPLSRGFSRQEHWRGCRFPLQGIFPTHASRISRVSCVIGQILWHHTGRACGAKHTRACIHVVTSRGRLPCPKTIGAHASSHPQPLVFHECVALRFPEPHGAGSRLCLPRWAALPCDVHGRLPRVSP